MATTLPIFLRKVLKFIIPSILIFTVITIIGVIYGGLKARWAKEQVEAYSRLAVIGMPVAGLENKAREMHLNYRRMTDGNVNSGKIYVWEGFGFYRWFCDVEYQDGKAIKKRVTLVD